MAFRNKDGDYLGSQSNYEYRGKQSLNRGKTSKTYCLFLFILLIVLFVLAALFLFYVSLFDKGSNADKNGYLLSGVFFVFLVFYVIYRFQKYQKEEKEYEKELKKLNNKKD